MIGLFASATLSIAQTPTKDEIMAKENAAWQAFKDKKSDDFKKLVDKDFKGVYADGIYDMAKEMTAMSQWNMKSFSISDYNMFSDEKDVIVTTYTVTLTGTFDGQDMAGTYNCGTVWKMEGTDWLAIFHTNIKQQMAVGDAQKRE